MDRYRCIYDVEAAQNKIGVPYETAPIPSQSQKVATTQDQPLIDPSQVDVTNPVAAIAK
ncbi:MAG: hypothetical protein LBC83_02390 [Oscillospiraceae bacterium]|jgi:hypothetical protein|nr:hypothetical protein [Oscillospiraceae bacterium]